MDLRIPLYLQLKNTLLNRIDNGELLPGERLESERDLAEKYGVNRQTVRSALNVLIEDGVLIKVPYKGTFVAKQIVKPAWGNYDAADDHRGFSSFLKAQGFTIDSKVIVAEKIEPTTSIRAHLKLEEGEDVYCLMRVRYYNESARDRPGRSRAEGFGRYPALPRRHCKPEPPHWQLFVPWPHGRWQDRAGQSAGPGPV